MQGKLLTTANFAKRHWFAVAIVALAGIIAAPRIIDGLTPVAVLAERYHERSKYEYRVGAICNDGWQSGATGRGACSHHGGVKEWIYQTAYKKTYEECRKEAEDNSWLK